MSEFFETTFGPAELEILESALEQWCDERQVSKHSADATLAAEIFINLFREGNKTLPDLQQAASRHKWLAEGSVGA
ncbi:hypothetical protein QTA58_16410 [Neorhizobium sp. CSC1952]|uniref:Uncharacterized protein n=1 Tax=Xaviernesmea oryzae TaxID=464029 RepID=A0A1X7CSW6_9HYPH|nr:MULTISPECIES: hypothetical protein [Rhizobium/Agrobacterium group]WJR65803.1 hypothetical protein QTA58_16410 [Rhizobium sp. CSC1952]SMF02540.1 hypothetical protein SAMN02982989_4539 [Xaviernesmea oryzae]